MLYASYGTALQAVIYAHHEVTSEEASMIGKVLESLQVASVAEFEAEAVVILSDRIGETIHLLRPSEASREVLRVQDRSSAKRVIVKLINPDGSGLYAHSPNVKCWNDLEMLELEPEDCYCFAEEGREAVKDDVIRGLQDQGKARFINRSR
jgi:hypothetical protein